MLQSLIIQNFAIIESCSIDFHQGMTVLTGQTGAGKSIIIDAIGQLLGDRSQVSMIKNGEEKAFIEGVFDVSNNKDIKQLLIDNDFDVDDTLIVSKSISIDGKSIIKMNYRTVPLAFLKQLMPKMVDIHSQFETHSLFNPKNHLGLLDQYIHDDLEPLIREYKMLFKKFSILKKEIATLEQEEYSDEQIDFYQAQLDEINAIDIYDINEDELYALKKKMENTLKIQESFLRYEYLMDNQVFTGLKEALSEIDTLEEDVDYQEDYHKLYDLFYTIKDIHSNFTTIYYGQDYDSVDLENISDILRKLNRLKKKYGFSLESIISARDDLVKKIEFASQRESLLDQLQNQFLDIKKEMMHQAQAISLLRKQKALILQSDIELLLKELHLPNVVFMIHFDLVDLNKKGIDAVSFLIQTNVGSKLQPLHKIASGGELSRIMLAIKLQTLKYGTTSTIIFDEADSGVSGEVAQSIGSVMKRISKHYQVLCITHLFQVAAYEDYHYFISKQSDDISTHVKVELLDEQASNEELAKMISGKNITEESLEHVRFIKKNLT